jgi:hypothetical protein
MFTFAGNNIHNYMENTKATDVVRARTHFRTSDGSYFCYDHIEGVLGTIVSDGSRKGIFVRTDKTGAQLTRQFYKEERYSVPSDDRLYYPLSETEWNNRLATILTDVDRTLITMSL